MSGGVNFVKYREYEDLHYYIANATKIGIFFHSNPDWDCLGSAFGLRQLILDSYDNKSVKVIGDRKARLWFLGKQGLETQHSLPESHHKTGSIAIVVDTWRRDRVDFQELLDKFEKIIVIDHHQPHTPQKIIENDLYIKDPEFISCAELILNIARNLEWTISSRAATFLYCGLFGDSQGFKSYRTNARVFAHANILAERGADIKLINQNIEKKDILHEFLRSQLIIRGKVKNRIFSTVLEHTLVSETFKNRFKTEQRLFYVAHSINIKGADMVAVWFKYINRLVICFHKEYNEQGMLNMGYLSLRNIDNSYSFFKTFDGSERPLEDEVALAATVLS